MTRRRVRSLGAGAAALFALAGLCAGPALADESRDDIADQQAAAAANIDSLRAAITDIDANLAQIYIDLQVANEKIPVAEKALADAEAKRDTAQREHDVTVGRLDVAKAEQQALADEVAEAERKQSQATQAIGDLARRMYQDGDASPAAIALTKSGTQSIDSRAAAAAAMARSQTQALNAALDLQASQRTQVARQDAITTRIADLEAKAKELLDQAQAAADDAKTKVKELEAAKADAETKQKAWDARKQEALDQLAKEEADYAEKTARLAEIDAANRASGSSYTSAAGFGNPVLDSSMIITSPFGWRNHPVLGYAKFHQGVDLAAACGEPIFAAADGVVLDVASSESAGNYVDVNHGIVGGNSVVSEYLHMQAIYVAPGMPVSKGQVIGEVGMTGYATGCHLHFGILQNGVNVDPMGYL